MPARSAANSLRLVPAGHGGPRPGSGRPRNPPAVPVGEAEIARVAASGETAAEMAHAHAGHMIACLLDIAQHGRSEAARVQAARALLRMAQDAPVKRKLDAHDQAWAEILNS